MTPAGAGVLPAAHAAVSGVSGEQQRQVESRSRGRRSRSSSDGTDRRAKKRSRRRSPSPERSSRLRKTELTSLLPELGVRMEVRMLGVGLPGIMIARLVLGRRDHL